MYDGVDSGNGPQQPTPKPNPGIPLDAAVIHDRPNWFLRLLGARWREDRGWRFTWGEWNRCWGVGLELINWGEDGDWSIKVRPGYSQAFIKLPFLPNREPKDTMDSWGFTWAWGGDNRGADIHFNWGDKCKIVHLPWDYVFIRHDMLCEDGAWRKFIGSWEDRSLLPVAIRDLSVAATETRHYRYVCRDGTIQDDIEATISCEEYEWRWRMLRWCPWFAKIRRSIDVRFSAEVGNQRGSWKGGVMGCGMTMQRDETPAECLRRMQRTKSFDR
jgi:hypothetical protein